MEQIFSGPSRQQKDSHQGDTDPSGSRKISHIASHLTPDAWGIHKSLRRPINPV